MAGISSSAPPRLAQYDVFLSFKGSDTRNTFASCLYQDLVRAGVRVFKDDEELSKGNEIGNDLRHAIANSRICMPILSPNFARSAWCLREVAHMVEWRQNLGGRLDILPIFYYVDVANVKLRPGSTYEAHVNQHRDRFGEEDLLKWKDALKKVGQISGWTMNDYTDHGQLIKSIVRDIIKKLNIKYRNVPTYLVGQEEQVDKVMKLIDVDSRDVRFIVIHGMGGIGKTTLANVLFNKLYSNYEGSSFLENVRETEKRHGLLYLQKKLLSDILNYDFEMIVKDINDGVNNIRGRLYHKKTLIVIDDVDDESQLKSLAATMHWFGSGSRIIVTTRNRGALPIQGGVHKPYYHEVKQMHFDDALRLFSFHAFGNDCPPPRYRDISRDIVSATASLPLALEVVGRLLFGKCMAIWKENLSELRRVPNKKVEEALMISINQLDVKQRKIFLDIACFLVNEDKDNAICVWSACGISTHLVINLLIERSLIKIDDNNKFWMHDQLRDLGREIFRRGNFNNRSSIVWTDQEAEEIINNKQGSKQVEVLCLSSGNFTMTCDALAKLENLKFLKLQGGQFKRQLRWLVKRYLKTLLPNLRWLQWQQIPSNFKLTSFCPSNLVVLQLKNSSINEQWKGWRRLKSADNLKVLDLTGCRLLKKTPNFSCFFRLERLSLKGCCKLVEIDPSIGKLKKLAYLNMEGCSIIRKFPNEIGALTSLTTILMRGDGQKFQLPNSLGNLTKLTSLGIRDVRISSLPNSVGKLKNLICLSLKNCMGLEKLPQSIGILVSLVKLDISRSMDITKLPNSIKNLKSLKEINMRKSGIKSLPAAMQLSESLEELQR